MHMWLPMCVFDGNGFTVACLAVWIRRRALGCAYRKSNPDIFVMQSAEDRAAKNTPRPHYGAR
jgi:hypothetical protein